jgi:hypothetical protein
MRIPFILALAMSFTCACGGGVAGPSPLGHTLDEAYIARVPLEQRPQVAQAQNDFALAKSEKLTAQQKVEEAETELKLAKNEVDQRVLEEKNAKVKVDSANSSGDQTRINAADSEQRSALLGRRAADAKLAWAKAAVSHSKKWLRFTEFDTYAKEAKFELEKARVAKGNNINPKGFAYEPFEQQWKDRSEAAQRAKAEAERDKAKVVDKEKAWRSAEKEWNDFRGVAMPPSGGGTSTDGLKPGPPDGAPATP